MCARLVPEKANFERAINMLCESDSSPDVLLDDCCRIRCSRSRSHGVVDLIPREKVVLRNAWAKI